MFKKISNHIIYLGLISIMFVIMFIKLSLWQYTRSQEKSLILSKINNQNITKLLLITDISQLNKTSDYNYVTLQGNWDYSHSIYLSNKFYNHMTGYHVITPFIIQNSKQAVLIDRGWGSDIDKLTNENAKKNNLDYKIQVTGVVRDSNVNQYIIGDNISRYQNKFIIQKLNLVSLSKLFPYPISDKYLNLISPKTEGFVLNWQWTNISPSKHLAYSIQWLMLAITTILLYSYLCYNTFVPTSCKK